MIAWGPLQAGLAALFTRLSGIPAGVATARDDGAGFTFPAGAPVPEDGSSDEGQVSLNFSIVSDVPWGRDELRTTYDPDVVPPGDTFDGPGAPLGSVIYAANGNREIVIEVTCDRFNQSAPAYETIQRIRDWLWLPSARAAMAELGLAVQKAGRIIRVDSDVDGRAVSRYVLEITANAMSNATDEPVTTIETLGGVDVVAGGGGV